ncbi:MAG: PhzF family phenazine biosynthesis protein [Deltaproteobacteria bacterium]|nr:PhzF family phenazine biosynthesis protein [Deltaproteobacteria bacterium]
MKKLSFYIVDVFAEKKYAGNQLAVFRGDKMPVDVEMQRIAREMNFSETTFITSETKHDGGFDVRIFTPGAEVPFAGHPTLGTAHIIRTEVLSGKAKKVLLNLHVGQIPVDYHDDAASGVYWMHQVEPSFGKHVKAEQMAPILGLEVNDMDERFPIEEVSTGLPHFIVPLKKLSVLKKARIDRDRYFKFVKDAWAKPILIFCPETHVKQNDISVRMFADYYGVPEDPATGSGNGCLAAYLVKHRYWGQRSIDIRSEQGYEIGRPSLLYLKAGKKGGKISVSVGGRAITIAEGQFRV